MLESCRRSSDVNFHFWLSAASSTNVRCRALRAAWTISVSSKSLMLRRIGTWKLIGARSIRNVIRTCASCLPRASASMRATVILNLLIPSLGLVVQAAHKHGRCPALQLCVEEKNSVAGQAGNLSVHCRSSSTSATEALYELSSGCCLQ